MVEVNEILQVIREAAFPAYRAAAPVAGAYSDSFMYLDERSELLPFAAGAKREQLRDIQKKHHGPKSRGKTGKPMHMHHRSYIPPVYRYLTETGFMHD